MQSLAMGQLHMQTPPQQTAQIVSLMRPCPAAQQHQRAPKCHLPKQGRRAHTQQRQRLVVMQAAGLDEGLSTSSSLLGPAVQPARQSSSSEAAGSVEGVELASEVLTSSCFLLLLHAALFCD